jgi:hypothetical protein
VELVFEEMSSSFRELPIPTGLLGVFRALGINPMSSNGRKYYNISFSSQNARDSWLCLLSSRPKFTVCALMDIIEKVAS